MGDPQSRGPGLGLRVTPEEERMGLDLSQHNERAYS